MSTAPSVLDLDPDPASERVLTAVDVAPAHRLRLAELGLRPGARVRVLGVTAGRGRLLGIGTGRLAVDRRIAAGLRVDTVAGPPGSGS